MAKKISSKKTKQQFNVSSAPTPTINGEFQWSGRCDGAGMDEEVDIAHLANDEASWEAIWVQVIGKAMPGPLPKGTTALLILGQEEASPSQIKISQIHRILRERADGTPFNGSHKPSITVTYHKEPTKEKATKGSSPWCVILVKGKADMICTENLDTPGRGFGAMRRMGIHERRI